MQPVLLECLFSYRNVLISNSRGINSWGYQRIVEQPDRMLGCSL